MSKNGYRLEGIILKRKDIFEADKIITIFSKQKGKIVCLAKGIRKINSKRAPTLELFNCVEAYIVKGHGFDLITEVQIVKSFPSVRQKLNNISVAYYLVELVEKLTAENQKNLSIYECLLKILNIFEKQGFVTLKNIKEFQASLLTELGFGLPAKISKESLNGYIEKILDRRINSLRCWNCQKI